RGPHSGRTLLEGHLRLELLWFTHCVDTHPRVSLDFEKQTVPNYRQVAGVGTFVSVLHPRTIRAARAARTRCRRRPDSAKDDGKQTSHARQTPSGDFAQETEGSEYFEPIHSLPAGRRKLNSAFIGEASRNSTSPTVSKSACCAPGVLESAGTPASSPSPLP